MTKKLEPVSAATASPQVAADPLKACLTREGPFKVEPILRIQSTPTFLSDETLDPSQNKKRKYIKREEVETREDMEGEEAKRRRL